MPTTLLRCEDTSALKEINPPSNTRYPRYILFGRLVCFMYVYVRMGYIRLTALIDLVHLMFCPPRCDDDAPSFPSARVAYHFSPVLPAWSWTTLGCQTLHHHHQLPHPLMNPITWTIFNQLTSWLSHWPLWLAAVNCPENTSGSCCINDALLNFWLSNSGLFFKTLFI